ncbi:MAG TPA: putative peptidoglycan glycosyltransferase FtsW [Candidatus Paceibacterota bacterium]|nr:putative peptidoglycan glycosyltransferase FtsW [Candidatus Paceibacterota bacterium]
MATRAPRRVARNPDYLLLAVVFLLIVFGLAMLASASSDLGKSQFNDTYYYLKHQILYGLSLGVVGFLVTYFVPFYTWKKPAFVFLLIGVFALLAVFTPLGTSAGGASRWLKLGPFSFQPAELMKLLFVVYLAAWFSNTKFKRATDFQAGFVPFLLVIGLVMALLLLQPATSTVLILAISGLAIYYVSGAPYRYIVGTLAIGLVVIAAVIYVTPYRRARIMGYLDKTADTQGLNYQVNQALIAIGSGGLKGVGYGQSATKASYLPTPIDDSIFAVTAEELGFIGASLLAMLFAILSVRMFWLAKRMGDQFGRLLLVGFGSVISLQAFVNMASISGLVPLTGVPLPFVSYGGTALAIFLTMMGISANVTKYR